MKYGKKPLFLLTLLLSLTTLFVVSSFAQTPANYDVTVSPVFFDLSSNPGGTVSDKIRIRNNTSSPLAIKLQVKKLTGDVNGNLTLKDNDAEDTLSWVKFSNTRIVAKPLEWTDVPFRIDVPSDAAYGYYFAVSFTQDSQNAVGKTGTAITGAAAVPILLNVRKEGANIKGELLKFSADQNVYEYPPVTFTTTFQNKGNVHIRPHGNIFIKDWLGREVAELNVNNTQGAILPNTKRSFETSWSDGFIVREPVVEDGQVKLDKNGKPETRLKIKFDKILDLRIGKYTATSLMVITTDTRDIPFQTETSFYMFPWKVLGLALLFILFAALGFLNTIRNFFRRIVRLFRKSRKNEENNS